MDDLAATVKGTGGSFFLVEGRRMVGVREREKREDLGLRVVGRGGRLMCVAELLLLSIVIDLGWTFGVTQNCSRNRFCVFIRRLLSVDFFFIFFFSRIPMLERVLSTDRYRAAFK